MHKFMKCLYTSEELEQKRIDAKINKILRKQFVEEQRSFKILLLGTGESGKTTFIKQMKIIHENGFNEIDRIRYKKDVIQNIICAMQVMLKAMQLFNMSFSHEQMNEYADLVNAIDTKDMNCFNPQLIEALNNLWKDPIIQECFHKRNQYQLCDSVYYFFNNLHRITKEDYLPTEQDILRVRTPTTGVVEYSFEYRHSIFRFVDVAGQRCERRKWIHCFEKVTSIIFLVAISEYDQMLRESANENRLKESKALFKTIAESQWFRDTSIILFLNKTDLLKEKIQHFNLDEYFPSFTGSKNDFEAAKLFIRWLFLKDIHPNKSSMIYTFFTCATDTNNIRNVFKAVEDTVLIGNLISLQLYD